MKANTKKILRRAIGGVLMVVGLAGLFFPILPGWILIFIGLEFLGIQIAFFEKIKAFVKNKLKK